MKCLLVLLVAALGPITGIDLPQFDDSILFSLNWVQNSWKPDELLKENRDYEVKTMMTPDQEKLKCYFPLQHIEVVTEETEYTGPSALSLLLPALKAHECNRYSSMSYWSYEVCHGQAIKQYHVESSRERVKRQDQTYTLGALSEERLKELEEQALASEEQPMGSTRVEGDDLPYVSVLYEGGDICQLTNQPRSARVLYVCRSEASREVYSVKETSSCVYEIVAFNKDLCRHPTFWKRNPPKNKVHCMMEDSEQLRPSEVTRAQGLRYKGLLENLVLMDDLQNKLQLHELQEKFANLEAKQAVKKPKSPLGASFQDLQSIKDFLSGKECIHSKSQGWWNTKLCYGKEILQYHDNSDGSQMKIHLGSFDRQKHIDWMKAHPSKAFAVTRPSANHLYADGAVCDVTKSPRSVVLKTVCDGRTSGSRSAVSLTVEEPSPCTYRVTLRGQGLCGAMRQADEWGLLDPDQLDATIFDDEAVVEKDPLTTTESKVLKSITELKAKVEEAKEYEKLNRGLVDIADQIMNEDSPERALTPFEEEHELSIIPEDETGTSGEGEVDMKYLDDLVNRIQEGEEEDEEEVEFEEDSDIASEVKSKANDEL